MMKPIGKRLIVKEDVIPEKLGSIYIPRMAKPQLAMLPHTCIILAISEGVSEPYKELKVGDRILINRLAPIQVLEEMKALVITEDIVEAKLED
jgi:co-chaperonin GroES (HSP10)